MEPVRAYIGPFSLGDRRSGHRRDLRLSVDRPAGYDRVTILDISTTGLRLETFAALNLNDVIRIDLPGHPEVAVEVVWTSGSLHGCRFVNPMSQAVVSAALLAAPFERPLPRTPHSPDPDNVPPRQSLSSLERRLATLGLVALVPLIILFLYALAAVAVTGP